MNNLSKKSLGLPKNVITIILCCIAILYGCQEKEKAIYEVPLSEHVMELKQQESAYKDSLEKYSVLLDTVQVQYYFALHKAALDTLNAVTQQEVEAFMAKKDRKTEEKADDGITTIMSIIMCVLLIFIIVMLMYLSRVTLFWARIGWAF